MPTPPCKPPGDRFGYGDVSGDGNVSSSDAMYVGQYLEGTRTLTSAQLVRANVKGHGSVSQEDVTLIMDFAAGKTTTFPVCGAPPTINCSDATPHFSSGCKLLLAYDRDNDGIVTAADALLAQQTGATFEEVQFIQAAAARGSINAMCPGCYSVTPPPANGDPSTTAITKSLEPGNYNIVVTKSGYNTVYAKINVSSTGRVSCNEVTGGACGGTGYPRVEASGTSVKVYMKTGVAVGDICDWITGLGGWKSIKWTSHVLEAYYVYIGASGHSVGFSPVTWNDVLGLYYYYINQSKNDPSAGNAKTGCGFT